MAITTELFAGLRKAAETVAEEAPKIFKLFEHKNGLFIGTEDKALYDALTTFRERGGKKLNDLLAKDIQTLMETGKMGGELEKYIRTVREFAGKTEAEDLEKLLAEVGIAVDKEGHVTLVTDLWHTLIHEKVPGGVKVDPALGKAADRAEGLRGVRDDIGKVVGEKTAAMKAEHARDMVRPTLQKIGAHVETYEISIPRIKEDKGLKAAYDTMTLAVKKARTVDEAEKAIAGFEAHLTPAERDSLVLSRRHFDMHYDLDTGVRTTTAGGFMSRVTETHDALRSQAISGAEDAKALEEAGVKIAKKGAQATLVVEKTANEVTGSMLRHASTLLRPDKSPKAKAKALGAAAKMLGVLTDRAGSEAEILHGLLGGKYDRAVVERALAGSAADVKLIEHDVAKLLSEGVDEVRTVTTHTQETLGKVTQLDHNNEEHAELASDTKKALGLLDRLHEAAELPFHKRWNRGKPLSTHGSLEGHREHLDFVDDSQRWMGGKGHTIREPEGRSAEPGKVAARG